MSDNENMEGRETRPLRGPDHQRSLCTCAIPRVKHHENNIFLCARCSHRLNTDTHGKAYRRWPGDLTEGDQHRLALVMILPEHEQQRLMRIHDERTFAREAAKAVRKYKAAKEYDEHWEQHLGPNARRRLQRRHDELVAQATDNDGPLGAAFRAVMEPRHEPEREIISQQEYDRRRREGEL